MPLYRRCEIFVNDKWVESHMSEIKKNNIFRLFEPDGTLVNDTPPSGCFIASCDAFPTDPEGNYGVKIY